MKAIVRNTTTAVTLALGTIATIAVPTCTARAAVPTDASLEKLIEVTKVVEQFNDESAIDITAQERLVSLTDEEIGFNKINNNEDLEYFNQLLIEAHKKAYIKVAKKHYNQQEINAQIDFYSSNIGQSLVSKQSAFTKDYMAEVEKNIIRLAIQDHTLDKSVDKDIETLIVKETPKE